MKNNNATTTLVEFSDGNISVTVKQQGATIAVGFKAAKSRRFTYNHHYKKLSPAMSQFRRMIKESKRGKVQFGMLENQVPEIAGEKIHIQSLEDNK